MSVLIKEGKPVYLAGLHYNIPLKGIWNDSLLSGLEVVAEEIRGANLGTDILGIDIVRIDDMAEFRAQGSIGYVMPSKASEPTGYYYVDFTLTNEGGEDDWEKDIRHFVALTNKLSEYLAEIHDYRVASTKYDSEIMDEGGMSLVLRAYFIRLAK